MKIEAGGFYQTREGFRVGPLAVWHGFLNEEDGSRLFHCPEFDDGLYWQGNGMCGEPAHGQKPQLDLVAEWSPTNTAPVSAGQSAAHTPGEWSVDDRAIPERGGSALYIRSDARHWAVGAAYETHGCTDPSRDISAQETRANALLFKAAPDLLAALRKARAALNGAPNSIELHRIIHAAIAAATGEAV